MNSHLTKMMFSGLLMVVVSCNSNSTGDSATKASGSDVGFGQTPYPSNGERKPDSDNSQSNALKYQWCLPQGIKPTKCVTALTLANSSSSVYDYLNHVDEAYKNEYYAANIDIIAIAESILKSQSPEEICRLSIQSLKALDSVRTNFRDPYGYLEDVYGRFLRASQATKAESCP